MWTKPTPFSFYFLSVLFPFQHNKEVGLTAAPNYINYQSYSFDGLYFFCAIFQQDCKITNHQSLNGSSDSVNGDLQFLWE